MGTRVDLPENYPFKRRVEVFKTNVHQAETAQDLSGFLRKHFGLARVNFDLDDCDNVLRIEGSNINPERVISVLHVVGYECELLE